MPKFCGFPRDTVQFLETLAVHNNREWFAENRERYQQSFLQPALTFIEAMQKPLSRVAPHLRVEAKTVGGSLMRIYKDVRFSRDKSPFKTNLGIHFRHEVGKDVHAPGIYIHIAPDECFFGAGIWQPAAEPLRQLREFIATNPQRWTRVLSTKKFQANFQLFEDRLQRVPRGFDHAHPLADSLRLKSFLVMHSLTRQQIEQEHFVADVTDSVKLATPLMALLCEALKLPY